MEKEYFIRVKGINTDVRVSKRTYYKIFNKEVGIPIKTENEFIYEISLETFKKYKKLYNELRRG